MAASDDLAIAHQLADIAAEVTMGAFGSRLPVTLKTDASPVTAIDSAAERAIRTAVQRLCPGDGVLGEEEGLDRGTTGRVWVIDPIDGTAMFAEGIPLWTTLIGLRDADGRISVGVADAPAIGERASAARGGGAFLGSRPLHVSDVDLLRDALVLHASVSDFAATDQLDPLLRLVSASRGTRGFADAWSHLLVARGSVEVAVEMLACYEWDWAATSVIVEEAGGSVSATDAIDPYPGCRLLVTNGLLDQQVRAVLDASPDPL